MTCRHCRRESESEVCRSCALDRMQFVEASDAGMIGNPTQKGSDTGVDALYRPLGFYPVDESVEVVLNGRKMRQRIPPTAIAGYPSGSQRDRARQSRELSESQAQRIAMDGSLKKLRRATQAAILGLTPDQLRRAITKHNKAAK